MQESYDENPLDTAATLIEEGRAAEAASLLTGLVSQTRGGLTARLLLARALEASDRLEEALSSADETAKLYPDVAEAALAHGAMLLASENLPDAIGELQRALRLDPEEAEARYLLGCAWLEAGEAEKALAAFAFLAPEEMPGLSERIAQAEAMQAQQRSDAGYVRHLFDQFSTDYDQRMLGQLAYQAPQALRELAQLVMPGLTDLAILDLGCGTGLSGAAFKDRASHMTGLDLSPAMIEKARARGVYDDLMVSDIESGLGEAAYDLVLAADTLVYIGDLETTFAAVAEALRSEGYFLFTTEAKEGEGFELGPKRRWRHSEAYLKEMAARHGFSVAGLMQCVPRQEAHVPVPGFAVALVRS
ncbi:putative TPR repeat methyltransferase [Rhizomicrobium palustre]|uniref:Putative TPR repeat methyltransferase n=1 Tax=Rhizomicrobium palustre TaxID=189966 RepID=A0A846MVU5_9PROT|nr:methyltransferase domain-containing protein [Rhizomicrobium palustre]NIK87339.1 putative TPR repeat methyltransferase [Rhizomicrobium palustre]